MHEGIDLQTRKLVIELADSACNGRIDDAGREQLEQLLSDSAGAREIYRHYMSMHADLYWQQRALSDDADESTSAPIHSLEPATLGHSKNVWQNPASRLAAFAATVLLGVGLSYLFSSAFSPTSPDDASVAATPAQQLLTDEVATVTATLNCRWELDGVDKAIGYGSKLYAGQGLHLREGLAEVTFGSGVKVILQAPSDWKLVSQEVTNLQRGRLTALVPDGAEGFRVNTQGLELIDRGTEFGVLADEAGNTELHVFDGLVEAVYEGDSLDEKTQWRTNDRVRFDPETRQVEKVSQRSSSFVRHLSPTLGPQAGLLLDEDFDYPAGPLSGQNGGFGWADAWEDLSLEGKGPQFTNSVGEGSLTFGLLNSSGNHACLKGASNRVRRRLATAFGSIFDKANLVENHDGQRLVGQDGSTVYVSFSLRVSDIDEGFYGVELHRGDGNRNRVLCVGHGAKKTWDESSKATGFSVTSEYNGRKNGLVEYGSVGEESNQVTFFVLKIVFGERDRDRVFVYRDPPSLWDESACEPVAKGKGNFSFDRIGLANFDGNKSFEVDHIRVATSYSAVTRPRWSSEPIASITENQ